jgi:hypothetical protein
MEMKKLRKTIVEKHPQYFYHPVKNYWVCKYCDMKVDKPSANHVLVYHSEEFDLEQHMLAHKEGRCKCSGSVMEL